jgi:ParB family transcriptional regulator, chromosome partitioning protein
MRHSRSPDGGSQRFRPLLNLDELKCSIEQISVRTGKNPAFVAARVKLTELAPVVIQAGA